MNCYKIILLGNVFVGKSSITRKYIYDRFDAETCSTIGASFFSKKLSIDSKEMTLNILDCAGANRFASLLPMYIKGSHGVVLVYDVTNLESFNRILNLLKDVERHSVVRPDSSGDNMIIYLIGNKCDLPNRVIMYEEGKAFAYDHDLIFKECSAFTGEGVVELFNDVAHQLIKKFPLPEPKNIKLEPEPLNNCCY